MDAVVHEHVDGPMCGSAESCGIFISTFYAVPLLPQTKLFETLLCTLRTSDKAFFAIFGAAGSRAIFWAENAEICFGGPQIFAPRPCRTCVIVFCFFGASGNLFGGERRDLFR